MVVNIYSNLVSNVVEPIVAASAQVSANIIAVGTGQSLMENWSATNQPYNSLGEQVFLATLKSFNANGTNVFINAGDGTSALFRSTCIAANLSEQDDYWIDDCGFYAAGTDFYDATTNPTGVKSYFRGDAGAPTPTVGVRYTDMLADIVAAGYTLSQVTDQLWCQGETEAGYLRTDNAIYTKFTSAQYQAGLQWLHDKSRTDMTNQRMFQVIGIGRRAQGRNPTGFEEIRKAQRNFCAANPTTATYGPEVYDLPQLNETYLGVAVATASQTVFTLDLPYTLAYDIRAVINRTTSIVETETSSPITRSGNVITFVTPLNSGDLVEFYNSDTVHRNGEGNSETAKRSAMCILSQIGIYNGNSLGPVISSATYDGNKISTVITHDKGSGIKTKEKGEYKATPITTTLTNTGAQLFIKSSTDVYTPIPKFVITGKSTIDLYPDEVFWGGSSQVVTAYGDMLPTTDIANPINTEQFILDNAGGNNLPLRSGSPVTFSGTTSVVDAASLVQNASVSLAPAELTAADNVSLASSIVKGRCLMTSLGITVPAGDVVTYRTSRGIISLKGSTSSVNISRLYSGTTEGHAETITWSTQIGQIPASIVDFVMHVPFTIPPLGSSTPGVRTVNTLLEAPVVFSRSAILLAPHVGATSNCSSIADNLVQLELAGDGASFNAITGIPTDLTSSERISGIAQIIQFKSGVVNLRQAISLNIDNATSNTVATTSAVTMANTIIFPAGGVQYADSTASISPAVTFGALSLQDANTIVGNKNTAHASQFVNLKGTLIELVGGLVSVQHSSFTIASSATVSPTVTWGTTINLNKTIYLSTGYKTGATTISTESDYTSLATISTTNGYLTRPDAATNALTNYFQLISMLV